MEEIIRQKKGKIVKLSSSIFEEHLLECHNSHQFSATQNDILHGKWCTECDNKILTILKNLSIPHYTDKKIGNFTYPVVIQGERNYLIFSNVENREDMIQNGKKEKFHLIIIDDLENKDLEKIIWDTIKTNKPYLHLEKIVEKKVTHGCLLTKYLDKDGNESSKERNEEEEGSVIKYAPEPYPEYMKKVVGYIRVSTVMQVQDGFSLEAQEAKIYRESEKLNGFLRAFYIDRGISGGSMNKRKSLEQMLVDLKQGEWIIVNSVSRLARNTKDLLSIVEMIEEKGCHLLILDLNLDITSPSGKLILTLMGSQAQFEREITSERVKGVMQHLKKTGALRTKPHFGMKMNPDHSTGAPIHIRDEKEQRTIEQIRVMRREYPNESVTNFAEILNWKKVKPPRKSKKWYHKSLRVIMQREGIK